VPQRRLALLVLLPLLAGAGCALAWLAILALGEAFALGRGEAWLMAWVLAFLVALPLALPALALARWLGRACQGLRIVPHAGVKVP
jgi:hypothetical protein